MAGGCGCGQGCGAGRQGNGSRAVSAPVRAAAAAAVLAVASLGAAAPARADACRDSIVALFAGGALDPFAQPPQWRQTETFDAAGNSLRVYDTLIETPVRQIGGIRGAGRYMMTLGADTWSAPAMEGPWTPAGRMQVADPEAAQRAVPRSMAANLSEAECPGEVEVGGRGLVEFRFRTRVDPDPDRGESWWSTKDRVWIDPATGRLQFWEQTEMRASWAPEVSGERVVISVAYDPTWRVTLP